MNLPSDARTAGRASLLDQTLAAAVRDRQTVSREGKTISTLIEGVSIRDVPTHIDERGSVVEIYDTRWGWHPPRSCLRTALR